MSYQLNTIFNFFYTHVWRTLVKTGNRNNLGMIIFLHKNLCCYPPVKLSCPDAGFSLTPYLESFTPILGWVLLFF